MQTNFEVFLQQLTAHIAMQVCFKWRAFPQLLFSESERIFKPTDWVSELRNFRDEANRYTSDVLRAPIFSLLNAESQIFGKLPISFEKMFWYAEDTLRTAVAADALLVPYGSPLYPALLRQIDDPPALLTVRGNAELLSWPSVAVIGARQASSEALVQSAELGLAIARKGLSVVSGGALGCDIAAHRGVLNLISESASDVSPERKSVLPAVAVMAGGLHGAYPKANLPIFRALLQRGGALVSERLWWSVPRPFDFPIRNRLVSGMCAVVVVVQAGEKSGALTTARAALDQGREVWVMEQSGFDVRGLGSRELLSAGAYGFRSPDDLCSNIRVL